MSVAEQLQRTPRGRLRYDRHRVCMQSIEDVLNEIHTDMDSMQVKLASPGGYSSPPSFGLSSDSEADTPLIPRTARMTGRGWSPAPSPARTPSSATGPAAARTPGTQQPTPGRSSDWTPERTLGRTPKHTPDGSGPAASAGPVTSTPRSGQPPTPFTPRAYDKLLHDQKQRHLQEAKEQARARLAGAEAALLQLRQQHEQRQQQLAAAQQRRGQQEREQRSLQRQRSEQQLQQEQESIRQRQQMDAKDLSERVQAAVQQQQADEEEHRQRAAHQRALLDQMVAAQKQMRTIFARVISSIKSCTDRGRLQDSAAAGQVEQLKQLVARMDRLVAAPPAELSVPEAEAAVSEATQVADQLTTRVDEINSSVAAAAEAAKEVTPETPAVTAAQPAVAAAPQPTAAAQPAPTAATVALSDFVLEENRVWYDELRQKATQFRAQFADLLANPALKKFKFDCQKAVNTPINAISPVSTAHLRDKLDKLRQLLRGLPVSVTGGQVIAAAHPHGVAFCLDLVAKKFVRQGEDVVSSKPEAAFALAAVLLALQLEFPQLAELTLAHCQARCPYLVPLYPPQLDGDSDEQYYRRLGYDYVDGAVEKQDKFLKRMSGVARLYATLLIARPPQAAAAAATRPLGVRHLWRWLASTVNLEPRVDITATLLHDVLEVGGATLSAVYGAQFVKLVRLLTRQFLPRVQQVTPAGCGGPVVRLEQQLQAIISTGRVPPPQGELKLYNW